MDGVDFEEVNRIRLALGMKPISAPDDSSTLIFKNGQSTAPAQGSQSDNLESRHAAAYDNWRQLEDQRLETEQRQKRKAELLKQRNTAQRFAQLEGKGLGELSEEDELEDTKSWLLKSRKRRKRIEIERAERAAKEIEKLEKETKEYTSADLAGLKVGHEISQFSEGGEQVLTLKDVTVGGDESEDDELENLDLRAKEQLEKNLKNKKRKLAYDPNATQEGDAFLAHYDEEISGPKKAHFSLSELSSTKTDSGVKDVAPTFQLYEEVYDKKRSKRRSKAKALVEQLRNVSEEAVPEEQVGLIIDETSEFVSALRATNSEGGLRKRTKFEQPPAAEPKRLSFASAMEDAAASKSRSQSPPPADQGLSSPNSTHSATGPAGLDAPTIFAEDTVGSGLGSTLNMLTSRGILQKTDADIRNDLLRDRQRFLSAKQAHELEAEQRARKQREEDRKSGKFDRMSAREKEAYSQSVNAQRELLEARKIAEDFEKHYKPDIELKYVDEYGQVMSNPKDAFKHLSHIFHGKGSGNKKTEKKLKKMADQKKKESQSIMDNSRNTGAMDSAAMNRAKNSRQAGVRFA